jgi:hypothetical protein
VTVHDMDVMAELTGLILFHTEFGIPSIPGGLMYLWRVTVVSAHFLAAGNWNHLMQTLR